MRVSSSLVTMLVMIGVVLACEAREQPVTEEEIVNEEAVDFEAITWELTAYRAAAGEMTPVLPESTIDLSFSGGEMGGTAGCNRYFGAYSLSDGNRLELGPEIGSTQMACGPDLMDQERSYLALLGGVAAVAREGDRLTLLDREGQTILEFIVVEPATLEGVEWQAAGINNGRGGVVSAATTSMSTAIFADGQLTGQAGCNRFNAEYQIEGDQITIGPAVSTKMFCAEPEGIMDQEQQFLAALARVRTYRLSEQTLQMRDEEGALQLSFRIGRR